MNVKIKKIWKKVRTKTTIPQLLNVINFVKSQTDIYQINAVVELTTFVRYFKSNLETYQLDPINRNYNILTY
jgi:hypothetical protein